MGVVPKNISDLIVSSLPAKVLRNKSFYYLKGECSDKGGLGEIVIGRPEYYISAFSTF